MFSRNKDKACAPDAPDGVEETEGSIGHNSEADDQSDDAQGEQRDIQVPDELRDAIREGREIVQGNKNQIKALHDVKNAQREKIQSLGCSKEAFDAALKYWNWDDDKRAGYDFDYAVARHALEVPVEGDLFSYAYEKVEDEYKERIGELERQVQELTSSMGPVIADREHWRQGMLALRGEATAGHKLRGEQLFRDYMATQITAFLSGDPEAAVSFEEFAAAREDQEFDAAGSDADEASDSQAAAE